MWEDIRVDVIRSEPVDQTGPCANHQPADDQKTTVFEAGTTNRNALCSNMSCYHVLF